MFSGRSEKGGILNPEEKEGEKSERDLSRQRGGGGLEIFKRRSTYA